MIKLFSEKVNPTFTSSSHNILTVEDFEEVFFDVFEFEINGTKYIAEKVSEYKGSPVVTIPVVEGKVNKEMPFVLVEGATFGVFFNNKNTKFIEVESSSSKILIDEDVEPVCAATEYKDSIFEEIEGAKKLAEEYAERVKLQKIEEADRSIKDKQQDIAEFFDDARGELLQEFNRALVDNRSDIEAYGEQKHSELEKYLTARIESNFNVFFENNNDRIKELTVSLSDRVDQITDKLVEEKINPALYDIIGSSKDTLVSITEDINNTLSETEQRVVERVELELNEGKSYIDSVERTIAEQNVELNSLIKKGVDKALGRVGNIKTSVLHLEEQLNSKVDDIKEGLRDLCEESIGVLGKEVGDRVEIDINKAKEDIYNRSKLLDESVKISVGKTLGKIEKVDESVERLASKISKDTKHISNQVDAIKLKSQQSSVKLNEEVKREVERLEESLDSKIVDKTKYINVDVTDSVSKLEEKVHADLERSRQHVDSVATVITQQGVELNNTVNEGISSTVDKVKSVEVSVAVLKEEVNKSVSVLEEKVLSELVDVDKGIRNYYDDRISSVQGEVKDLTEEQRVHFIDLIKESKESLLTQINEDKDNFKAVIINEAQSEVSRILAMAAEEESEEFSHVGDVQDTGDSTQKYAPEESQASFQSSVDKLKGDLERSISDKFTNEITSLKKLIEFSAGGGSIAMQFAAGGTMKGDLDVVGTISSNCGNSTEWCSTYTVVGANSANWDAHTNPYDDSLLQSTSGNWDSAYTTVSSNSASWGAGGGGDFCNEVVFMNELSSCGSGTISVSAGLDLNDYPLTDVHHIDFDLVHSIAPQEGRLSWNETDGTLDLGLKGGTVNLQIGMEQIVRARASEPILNGQVVYIDGALGSFPTVSIASNNTQLQSHSVIGVATESILNNQFGYITTQGLVRDLDTSNIPAGGVVYLGTGGTLLSAAPVTPAHEVRVGYCIISDVNIGSIYTSIDLGYDLEDAHDVLITTPQDADVLTYNSLSGIWENAPADHFDSSEIAATSATWNDTSSVVQTNSAAWDAHSDLTEIAAASGDWNSTYTTVQSNSATWGGGGGTVTANLSTYNNITTETTSTINVASTDGIILVDASAAAAVINLPSAVGSSGRRITVKKIDITNNTATLSANTDIDGLDTFTINKKYDAIEVMSDNAQWWII